MRAVYDDAACLQNMLDFEAALARAEAATGVIPPGAAGPISNACTARAFDLAAPGGGRNPVGQSCNPARQGADRRRRPADADAARHVHRGATSQDLIDTAAMLTERKGLRAVLTEDPRVTAHLSAEKVAILFEPMAYQGVSQALIDRLLASLDDK